jgi:hypothetical protein
MKTIIAVSVVASLFAAGMASILIVHLQPAFACAGTGTC